MQSLTISNRIIWLGVKVLAVSIFATSALAGGNQVIPATVAPSVYSLSDMAKATAFFNTSPTRTTKTEPDTPFQILYVHDAGTTTATFDVNPDTMLYVPVLYLDDTQPVMGQFPNVND